MTEKASSKAIRDLPQEDVLKAVSRRNFIKGVITSGVAVSSASYLFRASALLPRPRRPASPGRGEQAAGGVGERLIRRVGKEKKRRNGEMKQESLATILCNKLDF